MDAKQKKALSDKKYYLKNKEKRAKKFAIYCQTYQGVKSRRISKWKGRGVIHEDFNALYDIYLNTHECEECGVTLSNEKKRTKTTKCLDHCHETGLFRNILCHFCNTRR
jgi:hypothetical protein